MPMGASLGNPTTATVVIDDTVSDGKHEKLNLS
jgi:hypothetical protein